MSSATERIRGNSNIYSFAVLEGRMPTWSALKFLTVHYPMV